ncbi:unnamed protein product [Cuscuta epithymum]|uniref:histone acetyltransferase n=2 Tax=Cuscuta epithymum TaxID=186058 RepID=A0AAV0DK62_9ASTE|nr:unnamed protein product [Cuscuta epithymum]
MDINRYGFQQLSNIQENQAIGNVSSSLKICNTNSRLHFCDSKSDCSKDWEVTPKDELIGQRLMHAGSMKRGKQLVDYVPGMGGQLTNQMQQGSYYRYQNVDDFNFHSVATFSPYCKPTLTGMSVKDTFKENTENFSLECLVAADPNADLHQSCMIDNVYDIEGSSLNGHRSGFTSIRRDGNTMVHVNHIPNEIIPSPEPISSVTACSDGDWNIDMDAFDSQHTFSEKNTLRDALKSAPGNKPQHTAQNIYSVDVPPLIRRNMGLSDLNVVNIREQDSNHFSPPLVISGTVVDQARLNNEYLFPPQLQMGGFVHSDRYSHSILLNEPSDLRSQGFIAKEEASHWNVSSQKSLNAISLEKPDSAPQLKLSGVGYAPDVHPNFFLSGTSQTSDFGHLSSHQVLGLYVKYNALTMSFGNEQRPFLNSLHSLVCNGTICNCHQYHLLISHFESCSDSNCSVCKPVRYDAVMHPVGPISTETVKAKTGLIRTLHDRDFNDMSSCREDTPYKRTRLGNAFMPENIDTVSQSVYQCCDTLSHLASCKSHEAPLHVKGDLTEMNKRPTNSKEDPNAVEDDGQKSLPRHASLSREEVYNEEGSTEMNKVLVNVVGDPGGSYATDDAPKSHVGPSSCISSDHNGNASGALNDNIYNSPGVSSDGMHALLDESAHGKEDHSKSSRPGVKHNSNDSAVRHLFRIKSNNPKRLGVSFVDFFTADQITKHICSLRVQFGKGSVVDANARCTIENTCQLCGTDKLVFIPVPIYCSSCGGRIKRNLVFYYWLLEETKSRYCFCTLCFKASRGGNISFLGLSIPKSNLQKGKNNDENEESWVQCDKCECWQHQICALYNAKKDLEGKAKYTCPYCRLREIESGVHAPSPPIGARDLPRTKLSDHIEARLSRLLEQDKKERAKLLGKSLDEIPAVSDLAVRVVLSVNKQLKVKQHFLDIFHNHDYPVEFQYRSKVILLFQNIEGVDVCLFAMYVQEFGSECGEPNRRCVYVSYLDSVKYFRPEIQTATGEALRTFVYHEILIGYLEYCKKRGFATCYIWACPPVKGEDYILYCHPDSQKTPKSDKLRQWYRSMLKKASKENIVISFTNFYDHFFVPNVESNAKISAARLPYFDGDYWSGAAEDTIRNIDKDDKGGSTSKVKKTMTKRAFRAMGYSDLSAEAAKDVTVMQKLGQAILPVKEDFIIVNLQFKCTKCEKVISGVRWHCNQCRSFELCTSCVLKNQDINGQKEHTSSTGEKHFLTQTSADAIPADTEDNDAIIDNDFFEHRHSFLCFCQENHYQFESLRRAKHSSMMILYHLYKSIHCLSSEGSDSHLQQAGLQIQLLDLVVHASRCRATKSDPCPFPDCNKIRQIFHHAHGCTIRISGGCNICNKIWLLLRMHARKCEDSSCLVPRCRDLKRHAEKNALQSNVRQRQTVEGRESAC